MLYESAIDYILNYPFQKSIDLNTFRKNKPTYLYDFMTINF